MKKFCKFMGYTPADMFAAGPLQVHVKSVGKYYDVFIDGADLDLSFTTKREAIERAREYTEPYYY